VYFRVLQGRNWHSALLWEDGYDGALLGVARILPSKGRTIRYLRGRLGKYQFAHRKKSQKISCTTNLLKKKIEQELGVILKIIMQLFEMIKIGVLRQSKKNYAPPPRRQTFRENFLGHLKQYSAKECCRKKYSRKQLGDKKNSCTKKLPNPPLKYLMVRHIVRLLQSAILFPLNWAALHRSYSQRTSILSLL
jgi:hypothetical protein